MIKQFTDSLSQKDKTLRQLYRFIYEYGPISKVDLIDLTGLKQTTCTRLIDELLSHKLIFEAGFGESSGGRKPILYKIKPDTYYVFGIDISRTYTKLLLMDLNLHVLKEERLSLNQTTTPDVIVAFLVSKITELMEKKSLTKDLVLGIGIGSIGPLNRDDGILLDPVDVPSPGWEKIPIKDMLEKQLGIDVFIDYGVNTALLAEYQLTSFNRYQNIVYVIKGVGTRTGMIMDGNLTRGSDKLGRYGQGHMIINVHGKKCICGSYGCVHAYSSIPAIVEEVINLLKEGRDSILRERVSQIEQVHFDHICQAVNEGDPLCSQVIKDAAYYAGIGLSNVINVLHPELIILGGPTYTNMELFYETVKETALMKNKIIYPNHEIVISRGNLGENATSIGAGSLVLGHYLPN